MEREQPIATPDLMRSVRSLAWNRSLRPIIEDRVERAEQQIRGFLLVHGIMAMRVGIFRVVLAENGDLQLERLPTTEWHQPHLSEAQNAPNLCQSVFSSTDNEQGC